MREWRTARAALAAISFALLACGDGSPGVAAQGDVSMGSNVGAAAAPPSLEDVPAEFWEVLASRRIFFGHRSVGRNILEGIREVLAEHPEIRLEIVEADRVEDFPDAGLGHVLIGKNGFPERKVADFREKIEGGLGGAVDAALFKFCYVDIMRDTDVGETFDLYRRTMDQLAAAYPDTKFLYMTVPLHSGPRDLQGRVKDSLKGWMGRARSVDDNLRRNEFNALLRQSLEDPHQLFDIARVESTRPDGARSFTRYAGRAVHTLVPAYTSDGGHLSPEGRRRVAEHFLAFLALALAPGS